MKITLQRLKLTNFKGIKSLEIDFKYPETYISGDNGTGKTTILDSFLWLLFGKDSQDRTAFNIKTLDEYGKAKPYLDHEVFGEFFIDSRVVTFKRILQEKWEKPRGLPDKVFKGNQTLYYVDELPMTEAEYNKAISEICPESLFKLITNAEFFPSQPWTMQRSILVSLVDQFSNEDIISSITIDISQKQLDYLKGVLLNTELNKLKQQIATIKKKIKDDLDSIPSRIDEATRTIPENQDWIKIQDEYTLTKKNIEELEGKIKSRTDMINSQNKEYNKLLGKINNLKLETDKIKNNASRHLLEVQAEAEIERISHANLIESLIKQNETFTAQVNNLNKEIESLEDLKNTKLQEYNIILNETFDPETNKCPTCHQFIPGDNAMIKFTENREARIAKNISEGKAIATTIKAKSTLRDTLENNVLEIEGKLDEAKKINVPANKLVNDEEVINNYINKFNYPLLISQLTEMNTEFEKLHKNYQNISQDDITKGYEEEKTGLYSKYQELFSELSKRSLREKGLVRIAELEKQQKDLGQELADLENNEYVIQLFTSSKMRMVEEQINGLFRKVSFKLFDTQVNGQVVDTCQCTLYGVPYSDLNNGAKINAGLDIISTLSSFHDTYAPIFIDNRESVNEILSMDTQIINLCVTKDKVLTIN